MDNENNFQNSNLKIILAETYIFLCTKIEAMPACRRHVFAPSRIYFFGLSPFAIASLAPRQRAAHRMQEDDGLTITHSRPVLKLSHLQYLTLPHPLLTMITKPRIALAVILSPIARKTTSALVPAGQAIWDGAGPLVSSALFCCRCP